MEIWVKVLKDMPNTELKSLRLVSSELAPTAAKQLFTHIRLQPSKQSVDSLLARTGPQNPRPLHQYVTCIEFDLEPLFDHQMLAQITRGKRRLPASCSFHHFGTRAVCKAFKVFSHVDTIKIRTNRNCARSYPNGLGPLEYPLQSIIFQVMQVVCQLKSTVRHLEILSGGKARINLNDFIFLNHHPLPNDHRGSHIPRLPKLDDEAIQDTLAMLPPLRSLDLELFDTAWGRLERQKLSFHGLRHVLNRSAPELRSLSLSLATPGEEPRLFYRNYCWSHRRDRSDIRITWSDLFEDIAYPQLAKIYLRNVDYGSTEVGRYLCEHASVLQSVHLAYWDCNVRLPEVDFLRDLSDNAGDALSLLTLEACFDQHGQICRAQNAGDYVKQYYKINASKLAEILLVHNTSPEAAGRAVFLERLMCIADDSTPWWQRTRVLGHYHRKSLETGQAANNYRAAMDALTAEELSYRGNQKVQLVTEYEDLISDAATLRTAKNDMTFIPNRDLYIFVINDVPGLYLWTESGFQHFVTLGDERVTTLRRDVETDVLNEMLPVTQPYDYSDRISTPEFPHSTEDFDDDAGGLDFWAGRKYFEENSPDPHSMAFRIEVPELEQRRLDAPLIKAEKLEEKERAQDARERDAADAEMAAWFQSMRNGSTGPRR